MAEKLNFHPVNWENGMKIHKAHFIQQENAWNDRLRDILDIFYGKERYGLIPPDTDTGKSLKLSFRADHHGLLNVTIHQCRAISQSGDRIEILEEYGLPEFQINLSNLQGMEATVYYLLLSVDLFKRQYFGEMNSLEDPPRYPHTLPTFAVSAISESQIPSQSQQPHTMFIGKFTTGNGIPVFDEEYIPPCISVFCHPSLIEFYQICIKFFSQLENNLISIISRIREKKQDSSLAGSVLLLSENLLNYISFNLSDIIYSHGNISALFLFIRLSSVSRVMRNTIDTLAPSTREELLNYFSSWTELKQGDMEKLLTHSMNFEYLHYDMMVNTGQFEEMMKILSLLFDKLASLSYIGKKKETGIFVKEQKTKRSFLAD